VSFVAIIIFPNDKLYDTEAISYFLLIQVFLYITQLCKSLDYKVRYFYKNYRFFECQSTSFFFAKVALVNMMDEI
jgi:hypothetical protein